MFAVFKGRRSPASRWREVFEGRGFRKNEGMAEHRAMFFMARSARLEPHN